METLKLYEHQQQAVDYLKNFTSCLIGDDMGLGKTFEGSEMLKFYDNITNLVVCQKSKVNDWMEHFKKYYPKYSVYDLTNKKDFKEFFDTDWFKVGIINYDLLIRRPELQTLSDFTLLLDESSEVKNETSKRAKYILKMKPSNVILLTGTPINGKFEELWSQLKLLGWDIRKELFYNQYMEYKIDRTQGFPRKVFTGYKNKERLLKKLHNYGGVFRKTEEVYTLPQQIDIPLKIAKTSEYRRFCKSKYVLLGNTEIVGDTVLTERLGKRLLCSIHNKAKLQAFKDLINSTNDRLIVFYNFNAELDELVKLVGDSKPISYMNGTHKDLSAYDEKENSITFVQYQSGSMGLNLQKANKIIYFSPPDGNSIYFEQSKKRIHRLGQTKSCFYYYLIVEDSVETEIYETLGIRKNNNDELFKKAGE